MLPRVAKCAWDVGVLAKRVGYSHVDASSKGSAVRARAASSGPTVSVRVVARLLNVGASAGLPREMLMRAAHVTDADLEDPDARLPLAAEIALWQTFSKRISDPGFGVGTGASFHARDAGLVGYLFAFSDTMCDALRRLARYGRIISEAVAFTLDEDDAHHLGRAISHPSLGVSQAYAQDYRLAAVLSVCREITGADVVPIEATFTYRQASSTLAHREFFRCPITFHAPNAGLVFRTADLDLPGLKSDETLVGYLSEHAENVLASLVGGQSVRECTRNVIWSLLGNGAPSLKEVAGALHVTPRTLQRQLAAEGTTLNREIENVRRSMAVAVLSDEAVSIEEVAYLLGYAEPSAFFRSFKRWTGTTPSRFRMAARKTS